MKLPKNAELFSSLNKSVKSAQKSFRASKIVSVLVTLLDGSTHQTNVNKYSNGIMLFDEISNFLNILEKDYFGLSFVDVAFFKDNNNDITNKDGVASDGSSNDLKHWLDLDKSISKQIKNGPFEFFYEVKFYPPEPSQIKEDITRYYLCLQLRNDIIARKLPCSFLTQALLGSYLVQSELGDYDIEDHHGDYLKNFKFAPETSKKLKEKVCEFHKTHKSQTPAEAELNYLENAKKMAMYGVSLHKVWDSQNIEINLGVSSTGISVYKDKLRINRFAWPKILKISYKLNLFCIRIRPGEVFYSHNEATYIGQFSLSELMETYLKKRKDVKR